jgi:DNA repair protein RecO
MTHLFETVDAIIIAQEQSGEADKTLWMLSAEHGLIAARARGLRHLKSKLRYALQEFSRAKVSLVRGREIWRVATATPQVSYSSATLAAREAMSRLASLLRRMVGEEADAKLFADMLESFNALAAASSLKEAAVIERLATFRLLHRLGYVQAKGALGELLSNNFDDALILSNPLADPILATINGAIAESQL